MSKKKEWMHELHELYQEISHAAQHFMGYTVSQLFDYSKLFSFLKFPINNIGDCTSKSSLYRINTFKIEKKVIEYFAHLLHAPKNNYWGYVTNGGTEGNLHGLYIARELYPNGIVFLSDQSHYSAIKNLRILKMPYILIKSQSNGEINYSSLQNEIKKHLKKGPPILFINIGTTMKGAIDNLDKIYAVLKDLHIKEKYIHCDAAFYGMILPFMNACCPFDFRTGIDSLVISGHKMIGSPIPCGVIITKKSHVAHIETSIEYVGIKDRTISGSRNGITPLFLWQQLNEMDYEKQVKDCFEKAQYMVDEFNKNGICAWRNPYGVHIVLPKPSKAFIQKWSLPIQHKICCAIALPHLTYHTIDQFIHEFLVDMRKNR